MKTFHNSNQCKINPKIFIGCMNILWLLTNNLLNNQHLKIKKAGFPGLLLKMNKAC